MGLLDELTGKMTGAAAPATAPETSGLTQAVLGMLMNREGGLAGLVSAFQAKGLGDVVSSWVSTGNNLPVSPEQVQDIVGVDEMQQFAAKTGLPTEVAGAQLATLLPRVVDHLTPEGHVPDEPFTTKALDALKKLF